MSKNKNILDSLIKKGKIMVFSGTYCPYCDIAKSTLTKLNVKYDVRDLDKEPLDSQTLKQLNKLCGFTSIPKIFVGEQCIGGNDDLQELVRTGEFKELLKKENLI